MLSLFFPLREKKQGNFISFFFPPFYPDFFKKL